MTKLRTIQILRGTTAQNNAYTGVIGELTMDTEKKQLRIHDGSTAGGKVVGGDGITNQNPASGATNPIYDWVGTLAEYQAQNIETNHPDWVCYITDDFSAQAYDAYSKAQTNSLLADKVDVGHQVIAFQAPTAQNGYTWYRKYADGWVEQGGCYNNSNTTQPTGYKNTITWAIPFADTHYTVTAIGWSSDDSGYYQDGVFESSTTPRTATTFTVDHESHVAQFNLIACGMAA